jgi:replicative DNA helicase
MQRTTSEILDRLPPSDQTAERNVLGSILLDHRIAADVRAIVTPNDFYAEAHQRMYRAMLAIEDERGSIDVVTLVAALKASGSFEAVGGNSYILEVFGSVAVPHHAEHYARIVADHARRRAVIHSTCEILRDAYDPGSDPGELVARGQKALAGIEPPSGKGDPEPIGRAVIRAMQAIDAALETGEKPGVLTGLYGFDNRFGGLARGELVILAGRPGDGKTSLACQISDHVASRGRNVYFASLEMANSELATRILCSRAGVSSRQIRNARLTAEDREALVTASNAMPHERLVTHDRARLSVYEISHAARKVARDGIGLVVVDYLQRITPANRQIKRHEQIGEMTDGLKALARELECPVLCLAQLSRAAEGDTEPRLSHLRESGSIEADADIVFFIRLHPRAGKQDGWWTENDSDARWNAELIIGKGRNMGRGALKMEWEPSYTRFRCIDDPVPYEEFAAFSGGMNNGF